MTFTATSSRTKALPSSAANLSIPPVATPTLPTTPISSSSTYQPGFDLQPLSREDTSSQTSPSKTVTQPSASSNVLPSVSVINPSPTQNRSRATRPSVDASTHVSKTQAQNNPAMAEETEEQKREAAVHVTIWNRAECRKIAGNAAPLRRNLARYLQRHPECEEYVDQDKQPNFVNSADAVDPATGLVRPQQNDHVPIWNRLEQRKVTGNAAPLRKNLEAYLAKHPEYEVYAGQDKETTARAPWPPPSTAPSSGASSLLPNTSITNTSTVHTVATPSGHNFHFVNAQGKPVAFGPPLSLMAQSAKASTAAQNHDAHWIITPTVNAGDLSYCELASSWSHNHFWAGPLSPTGSHPSYSPAASPPTHMDVGDNNISISIPSHTTDIAMTTNSGTSYGASAALDVPNYFAYSPRSMDLDPDDAPFSPSNFLCTDVNMSGADRSPSLQIPPDTHNSMATSPP